MNLLLIADTYYEKTLLHSIQYIYNCCDCICLLNDRKNDELDSLNKLSIMYYSSIDDAVEFCDEILIITNDTILSKNKYIRNIAKRHGKKLTNINMNQSPHGSILKYRTERKILSGRPIILSLSVGKYTQQYHTEIFLNKIFTRNNFSFKQVFSPTTQYILKQQSSSKNFYSSITEHLTSTKYDYDVFIGGLSINSIAELLHSETLVSNILNDLMPDLVMVDYSNESNYHGNDINEIINILKYRFGIQNTIICNSEFIAVPDIDVSLYLGNCLSADSTDSYHTLIRNWSDEEDHTLEAKILSTIYLPDQVYLI